VVYLDFDKMIQLIAQEVLKKLQNIPKKGIVLFTGGNIGFKESISQIVKLKESGWNLRAVLSKEAVKSLDVESIKENFDEDDIFIDGKNSDTKGLYSEIDALIIASLTINSAAKISTGVADTLPTQLAAHCIMNGTRIIAAKDACDLRNPSRHQLGYDKFPNSYFQMVKGHLDKLESYGIKLINAQNLYDYLLNSKDVFYKENEIEEQVMDMEFKLDKRIISREDIVSNSMKKKIVVPINAMITSLAQDIAREIGVEIIKR
jgi:hypothetical protein